MENMVKLKLAADYRSKYTLRVIDRRNTKNDKAPFP